MDIGVIGGADGPTAILIAGDLRPFIFAGIGILVLIIIGVLIYIKKRK